MTLWNRIGALAGTGAIALLVACGGADYDDGPADDAAPVEEAAGTEGAAAATDAAMDDAAMDETAPVATGLSNANTVAAADLESALSAVPGAAQAILAARPFSRPAELHAALSAAVGEEAAKEAYEMVWVPLDLNEATRDEILLIPGVGDRMAHEFEEYRPYADMDQFRREIGKYVDEEEVARLEQYVTIH